MSTPTVVATFNTGLDYSVRIVDNLTNSPIALPPDLMHFDAKPTHGEIKIEPLSNGGYDKVRNTRKGWTGTIQYARVDGTLNRLEYIQERDYHLTGKQYYYTIFVDVQNEDSTINHYRFDVSTIALTEPGNAEKEAAVLQTLSFTAQTCVDLDA